MDLLVLGHLTFQFIQNIDKNTLSFFSRNSQRFEEKVWRSLRTVWLTLGHQAAQLAKGTHKRAVEVALGHSGWGRGSENP